jgi:inosose dehydratase
MRERDGARGLPGWSIGHKYPADPAVLKEALDLRGLKV